MILTGIETHRKPHLREHRSDCDPEHERAAFLRREDDSREMISQTEG